MAHVNKTFKYLKFKKLTSHKWDGQHLLLPTVKYIKTQNIDISSDVYRAIKDEMNSLPHPVRQKFTFPHKFGYN